MRDRRACTTAGSAVAASDEELQRGLGAAVPERMRRQFAAALAAPRGQPGKDACDAVEPGRTGARPLAARR